LKRTVLDIENRIDPSNDATPICQYHMTCPQRCMYWTQSDADQGVVMIFVTASALLITEFRHRV
jgi:hypothetical protein